MKHPSQDTKYHDQPVMEKVPPSRHPKISWDGTPVFQKFPIAERMRKRLRAFVAMFFFGMWMFFGGEVRGQETTVNITISSTGITSTSYDSGAERTWTQDEISFGAKAVLGATGSNAGTIQFQANKGVLYNTDPIPGVIKTLKIIQNNTNTFTLYGGAASRLVNSVSDNYTVSGGITEGTSSGAIWTSDDLTSKGYSYFAIKRNTSNTSYVSSIEITYVQPGPILIPTPSSLTELSYMVDEGPSLPQSFSLEGIALEPAAGNIVVTAPPNFEVSDDGEDSFSNSLIIPYTDGSLAATNIYVRLVNELPIGSYNGDITISGGDAPNTSVALEGEVMPFMAICGLENFNNATLTDSYADGSFVGNDGITWNYGHSRDEDTFPIDGNGLMLRRASDSYLEATFPEGVETISFDYRKAFTGGSDRQLELIVDGVQVATTPIFGGASGDDLTIHHFSYDVIEPGSVTLRIKNVGSTTTNRQTVLDNIFWTCITECSPDPMVEQASFHLNSPLSLESSSAQLRWNNGDGDRRIVVVREGSAVNGIPTDEVTYSANNNFGSGDEIGSGNFVVYNGTGNQVDLIGLNPGTEYFARVFEYTCPGDEVYLTTLAEDDFITPPMVPTNFSMVCKGETSIDLAWSPPAEGNFDGYILVVREGTTPHAVTSLDPSSQSFSSNYSTAPSFGTTTPYSKVVYRGAALSASVTNLDPNVNYTFQVLAYTIGTSGWKYSSGTTTSQIIELADVISLGATPSATSIELSWALDLSCVDEVIVAAFDGGSVLSNPTGSGYGVNSNSYTDVSNPTLSGGEKVVFSSLGTSTIITNLTTDLEYCFKVFVRKGSSWSEGTELCETPRSVTILQAGDISIVAINTATGNPSSGSDEICFFSYKSITPNTSIDLTDNGYERNFADKWGDSEGVIRITRKSTAPVIPAGKVICIAGSGHLPSHFTIYTCGVVDNDWVVSSLNGSNSFDLNKEDQLWILQNGNWVINSGNYNDEYTGNVIYGWTATGWMSAPGYNNTKGSTLYPSSECFNTDLELTESKVKYNGPMSETSRINWILRINDEDNWLESTTNSEYNSSGFDYRYTCISFDIGITTASSGMWTGDAGSDWFQCRNWQNLKIPDASTAVTINNHTNQPEISIPGAECLDLIINSGGNLTLDAAASDLEIGGDLTLRGTLTNTDGTIIFNGITDQLITDDSPALSTIAFKNIEINKPAGILNIEENISVSGNATFTKGIVNPNSDVDFTFQASATAISASNASFIDGRVRKSANTGEDFTFPIGDTKGDTIAWYQPARIFGNSGNTTIAAQYFAEAHPEAGPYHNGSTQNNQHIGTCDFWRVEKVSGVDVRLGFTYINPDDTTYCNDVGSANHLTMHRWNGLAWDPPGNGVDPTSGEGIGEIRVGLSGVATEYGDFALSSTNGDLNVLPIELLRFEAVEDGAIVQTAWATSSESNNAFFTVERSADARTFQPIGKVDGAGNSHTTLHYAFTDQKPLYGISYYRLKQTDFDGLFTFSDIRAVSFSESTGFSLDLTYRNENELNLVYRAISPYILVEIFDVLGKRVFTEVAENYNGRSVLTPTLGRGAYVVRISSGAQTDSEKIVW